MHCLSVKGNAADAFVTEAQELEFMPDSDEFAEEVKEASRRCGKRCATNWPSSCGMRSPGLEVEPSGVLVLGVKTSLVSFIWLELVCCCKMPARRSLCDVVIFDSWKTPANFLVGKGKTASSFSNGAASKMVTRVNACESSGLNANRHFD